MANLNSTAFAVPILFAAQTASSDGINPILIIVPIIAILLDVVGWYVVSRLKTPNSSDTENSSDQKHK
jgi:hypothetical protein